MEESLSDIIEEVMARNGLSARQMDANARRMGYSLNYTTINHIRNGTHGGRYQLRTLEAIAAVGGLSRERVFHAAGLPLPGRPFVHELPHDVDYLDRSSRDAVIGVIRELLVKTRPGLLVSPPADDYGIAAKDMGRDPGTIVEE